MVGFLLRLISIIKRRETITAKPPKFAMSVSKRELLLDTTFEKMLLALRLAIRHPHFKDEVSRVGDVLIARHDALTAAYAQVLRDNDTVPLSLALQDYNAVNRAIIDLSERVNAYYDQEHHPH